MLKVVTQIISALPHTGLANSHNHSFPIYRPTWHQLWKIEKAKSVTNCTVDFRQPLKKYAFMHDARFFSRHTTVTILKKKNQYKSYSTKQFSTMSQLFRPYSITLVQSFIQMFHLFCGPIPYAIWAVLNVTENNFTRDQDRKVYVLQDTKNKYHKCSFYWYQRTQQTIKSIWHDEDDSCCEF